MEITSMQHYQKRSYELLDCYYIYGSSIYLRSLAQLNSTVISKVDYVWYSMISPFIHYIINMRGSLYSEFLNGEILNSIKHMILRYRMVYPTSIPYHMNQEEIEFVLKSKF